MAASAPTAAQTELINSLSQDEIPIKLRCAICSRLAVNAFRLPCCDQAICETCKSTLPSSCPVCEHTPVAAADCKPNKSLRTTIKVFLRTEEKKREALRLKEQKNSPPITPPASEDTAVPVEPVVEEPSKNVESAEDVKTEEAPVAQLEEAPTTTEESEPPTGDHQDVPQPSIEEIAPGQEPTADNDANKAEETAVGNEEGKKDEEIPAGQAVSQTQGFGAGFGFDPSAAGGFPGMGFGGDFNQMQMMMAMQNGIGPGGFTNFPMMGMPGMPPMGMDPMSMQFMNGGFGGGMNGMGMGFDGGAGAGFGGGWNGQQAWNVRDNFNASNVGNMGHSDYASNNSGYGPQSGFNQGNYGGPNQFNNHQNNFGSFRGRGRGRGGFSRGGGYGYGSNDAFSHQLPQQFGAAQQPSGPPNEAGSVPPGPSAEAGNVDEFGREIRQKSATAEQTPKPTDDEKNAQEPGTTTEDGPGPEVTSEVPPAESTEAPENSEPMPIQTLDDVTSYPYSGTDDAYNVNAYGGGYPQDHSYGGRGGNFLPVQPPIVKPVDVPINAPTGPKAMREGLPNTGLSGLRTQGFSITGRASSRPSGSVSASVAPDTSEKGGRDRERSRSPSRERSRSRDRKRSRSRDKSRRHRHRSTSLSEDEKETERRRERRKERRRRREEDDAVADELSGERLEDGKSDVVVEGRSRSASPSDSKRTSHRSRRDRDKYRERESERDHKSSSHKHRSHRSSRHDEKERSRSRDRDREREHRHRHSRRQSEEPLPKSDVEPTPLKIPIEPEPTSRRPSTLTNGIEIKGASSRRKSTIDNLPTLPTGPRSERITSSTRERDRDYEKPREKARDKSSRHHHDGDHCSSRHDSSCRDKDKESTSASASAKAKALPTPPAKDPHELEREARNRERLLKEAQRMAGLTGGFARKRSRDEGDEGVENRGRSGKKGRKGRRGTGLGDESEEARIARLEAERESARWG